jgi:hypothetical protein
MKYLNLDNNEMRELLYIRRERFVLYFFTLLFISIGSYFLFQLIMRTPWTGMLALLIALSYTGFWLYTNRKYLKELIRKQKKVYRGALSFKAVSRRNKKRKYMFNIDGHVFYVDRRKFECIQEGDIVEFHVSSSTKHVFKMEKIE